jgi:subtilisin family serine protease
VKALGTYDRELPCEIWGYYSQMIEGLDWISADAKSPSIVNMSIAGGKNETFNTAVNNLYDLGIPVIVAAGNNSDDASIYSPASAERAFTVGASTENDQRASFSNIGETIKLFAPGTNIWSAFIGSNSSYSYTGGTSMSAPYVVGVAALFLENNPYATPQQVYDFLIGTSTKNKISISGSVNNHLLFSGLNSTGAGQIDPNRINYGFELIGTSQKQKANDYLVTLSWSPVKDSNMFDLFVDGLKKVETNSPNTIIIQEKGRNLPPKTYQLCVQGTSQCSNSVTVYFN